ncbi:MAG: hypothetical protein J6X61_04910 [Clostridia bacterium]|nr:hypothetical protein [Clostridia bacterium]
MSDERSFRSKAEVDAYYEAPERQAPLRPVTFKQKVENFWFYHKKAVLLGGFLVIAFGFALWQFLTREKPDYIVMLAMDKTVPAAVIETVEDELSALGEDLNGDGRVIVSVYDVSTAADRETQKANATKMLAELQNGEVMLFLTDGVYFDKLNDLQVFEERADFPDREGLAWNLRDTPLCAAIDQKMPGFLGDEFLLGKRVVAGTDFEKVEKSRRAEKEAVALMERLRERLKNI